MNEHLRGIPSEELKAELVERGVLRVQWGSVWPHDLGRIRPSTEARAVTNSRTFHVPVFRRLVESEWTENDDG